MTFGQLLEYNMRTIFLEKSCSKCDAKAIVPDSFIKIKFEHVSWSTVWNVLEFIFIVCPSQGLPKYIKISVQTTCSYLK